jgi:DnaD/phage-associated family protein
MSQFTGFPSSKVRTIRIPELFFQSVLPMLKTELEVKIALLTFWLLEQQEGATRFIRLEDYFSPPAWFMDGEKKEAITKAKIKKTVQHLTEIGMIIAAQPEGITEPLYFLNSDRGKALAQAYLKGNWQPGEESTGIQTGRERRTIYQLYEENIGPLTPLIADSLKEAETTYHEDWIKDAIQIAVENNVRRWKYIEAILASWKEEGRYAKTKRDYEESYRKYFQEDE